MGDDEHTVGTVVTTTVAREGVLEEIVEYSGSEMAFYRREEDKPYDPVQESVFYGISTKLSIRFDDSPDEAVELQFPLQVYLPMSMMPEDGWRIRYTSASAEPALQDKLDAYASAGADFGTFDECLPSICGPIINQLYAALDGEGFVKAVQGVGTNRKCRLTLEFLRDDEVVRTYTFKADDWERDVWEMYKDKLPETL